MVGFDWLPSPPPARAAPISASASYAWLTFLRCLTSARFEPVIPSSERVLFPPASFFSPAVLSLLSNPCRTLVEPFIAASPGLLPAASTRPGRERVADVAPYAESVDATARVHAEVARAVREERVDRRPARPPPPRRLRRRRPAARALAAPAAVRLSSPTPPPASPRRRRRRRGRRRTRPRARRTRAGPRPRERLLSLGTSNHGHTSRISHANATASFCANPFSGSSTRPRPELQHLRVPRLRAHRAPPSTASVPVLLVNTATRYRTQ